MKSTYENVLILGGAYAAGDVVLRPLPEDVSVPARLLLLFAFLVADVMTVANRPPRFIGYLNERFPHLALCLKSIGWLPYFLGAFFGGLIVVSEIFNGGEIYPLGTAVSLLLTAAGGAVSVAAYVAMRKKRRENL